MFDLHLATNGQLIQELINRETFLGVIIASMSEVTDDSPHGEFELFSRNLNSEQIITLFNVISKDLEEVE